ncbi:MAG: peptidoglycan-binding protein [Solirubrobacterales bacterium]|nr:peptidoglycan-binding protein [Solirubrobacterales bacterium]
MALLLMAALLFTPAPKAAASPFDRHGMWIWYISSSEGGDLTKIIKRARQTGIRTLYVKSGDGTGTWSQFNKTTIRRFHRAGLKVCGWQYVYGKKPGREARVSAAAKRRGADCFVIDAESEYEGNYSGADRYIRKLRGAVGKRFPIALSTFPYGHYHPAFPYSVFLGPGAASANMPQVYWDAIGDTVREAIGITWLDNDLYERQIYPVGQTYQNPRAKELIAFRRYAESYGTAPSWWSWQETNKREWKTLGRSLPGPYKRYQRVRDKPTMKSGSRGDMVVWLQQHLNGAGIKVPVTGIYDRKTIRGVKKFQGRRGLGADGVSGTQTWNRLLKVKPVRVRWSGSRSKRRGAGISATTSSAPLSANLPMKRNELAGAENGAGAPSR